MKEKANRRRVEEIALMDVDALLVNCGGVDPADAATGNYTGEDVMRALRNHYRRCLEVAFGGLVADEVAEIVRDETIR
ncbi:MAG TPA: hypothetical protein PK022_06465 [Syntrophales bacterium]|nr:hypothetical protein [Syntrophales bacterium]